MVTTVRTIPTMRASFRKSARGSDIGVAVEEQASCRFRCRQFTRGRATS
jgi:hypothetical protein